MDYEVFKARVRDLIQLDLGSYKQQQMQRRILQWIAAMTSRILLGC